MDWDQKNLAGKVFVNGVQETANQYVPVMRSAGADLVVALSHGGLDASPYSPKMENGSLYLASTGIDALAGRPFAPDFPGKLKKRQAPAIDASLAALPKPLVDSVNGFVNGVPTVMAQSWGRRLGIIKMTLVYQSGKWVVQKPQTTVEARGFKYKDGVTSVAADPAIATLSLLLNITPPSPMHSSHWERQPTLKCLRTSRWLGDVGAIQIVNQAQIDYVKNFLATTTDATLSSYKNIPVISCSAPFKAGRNGPTDFTDVAPTATLLLRLFGLASA